MNGEMGLTSSLAIWFERSSNGKRMHGPSHPLLFIYPFIQGKENKEKKFIKEKKREQI